MAINYREDPTFNPHYTHVSLHGNGEVSAPFPVVAFGRGESEAFLGLGNLIGSITTELGTDPIIEIEDISDGQSYNLLGKEIQWGYPVTAEMAERIAAGDIIVASVRVYVEALRSEAEKANLTDDAWLENNGIMPGAQ